MENASRLQKILSAHGIASRRKAEEMIASGRVCVNGATAELGQSAVDGIDIIELDGKPLPQFDRKVYVALNKPRGYLTTVRDDRGRATVMELVSDAGAGIYPAGRLDMDSEGLLILTNDGEFANALTHPSNGKRKVYEVHVKGNAEKTLHALREPMMIDGHLHQTADVSMISVTDAGCKLSITLIEGRNRQIRKMCRVAGAQVLRLKRVSIGGIELGSLQKGEWRHLTDDEIRGVFD